MISIIIPTLNEENYLPLLLKSLALQKGEIEVIVVDAGSSDRTIEVVGRSLKKYTYPIRWLENVQGGVATQRNEGAKMAKGKWLIFLDADVVLPQDFLAKAMREIEQRQLVICGTRIFAAEKGWRYRIPYWIYSHTYYPIVRLFQPILHGCSIIVTREIHERIGGFLPNITFEDYEYAKRASVYERPVLLKDTFVRTSARRFYAPNWGEMKELINGALATFFRSGIRDPNKFKHYHKKAGRHPLPRYGVSKD